ncbi:MAG: hypothetical protein HY956_09610 [Deltaproteobacteria bacterium]|nr:hypothetical protein [Deltaproteobacteria bacterium]
MSRLFLVFFVVFISLVSAAPTLATLDPESADCMGCHDAAIASDVTITVCSTFDCDHPVGVNYVNLASANHGLAKPAMLPSTVQLKDNMVGCGTCHIPYTNASHWLYSAARSLYPNTPDPMLVMDNRRSELCMTCHLKE